MTYAECQLEKMLINKFEELKRALEIKYYKDIEELRRQVERLQGEVRALEFSQKDKEIIYPQRGKVMKIHNEPRTREQLLKTIAEKSRRIDDLETEVENLNKENEALRKVLEELEDEG